MNESTYHVWNALGSCNRCGTQRRHFQYIKGLRVVAAKGYEYKVPRSTDAWVRIVPACRSYEPQP